MRLHTVAGALALAAICSGLPIRAQSRITVWDGVFTSEQAARGRLIFASACADCHGSEQSAPNRPSLKGEVFLNHWMEDSLDALLNRVKSMPNRVNLDEAAYADVLAFLLEANGFPPGKQALKTVDAAGIRVQGKNGPAPVPNFSLVEVVACFTRGPQETWILTNGSEPTRTRNPGQPTSSEFAAAVAKPLGKQTFQLLDVEYFSSAFRPESHAGHKVNAKGFLIRNGGDVRINVTWIEKLAADCGP